MKRKEDEPTVIDGLMLGPENLGVVALLTPGSALLALPADCQPCMRLDRVHDAAGRVLPWPPIGRRKWQQPTSLLVLPRVRLHAHALLPALDTAEPQVGVLRHGTCTSAPLFPTASRNRLLWRRFRQLVGLSGLGLAFVLAALAWEFFALTFSQRAGWGWDKGAFFFAWALGMLAFGFYLRTSRKQPAGSRLFLGVNILLVSVLSFVVATR